MAGNCNFIYSGGVASALIFACSIGAIDLQRNVVVGCCFASNLEWAALPASDGDIFFGLGFSYPFCDTVVRVGAITMKIEKMNL